MLFNERPSDNDSTISSESCSDEVLPQSDLGDTEDVHNFHSGTDEEDDTNFPSQISEVKREKEKVRTEIHKFTEFPRPSEENLDLKEYSSLLLFLALFTLSLMNDIVFQTNLYSAQQGKQFSVLTLEVLCWFIAINSTMRIKKMLTDRVLFRSPARQLHFKTNEGKKIQLDSKPSPPI